MRTWQICLLALSAITAVCAQDPATSPTEEPLPSTPTEPAPPPTSPLPKIPPVSVEAALINQNKVLVYWKISEEVPLEAAEFTITATPNEGDPKVVSVKGKVYSEVEDLAQEKEYTITVGYVRASQTDLSDPVKIKTSQPPPEGPNTVKTVIDDDGSDPDTMSYKTTWVYVETALTDNFAGYEILYCTSACDKETSDKGVLFFKKPLDYYTKYNVYVSAAFKEGENEQEQKSRYASDLEEVSTTPGKPGQVEDLDVDQELDTLNLDITWAPPNQPHGKVEKYIVDISVKGASLVNEKVTDLNYTYPVDTTKEIIPDQYVIEVTAINNAADNVKTGVPLNMTYDLEKPAPPSALVLKGATTDSIEIEIRRDSAQTLIFEVTSPGKDKKVSSEKIVKLDGFGIHENVDVSVVACIALDDKRNFCGVPKTQTFPTNSGAPSAVKNLNVTEADGKYTLRWGAPDTPAGPIDGYTVRVTDKANGANNQVFDVEKINSCVVDVKDCTEYTFAVRAFNEDVVSQKPIQGPYSDALAYTTANCPKGFPVWAIVLIVVGIVGAAGGGGYYFVKMRRDS